MRGRSSVLCSTDSSTHYSGDVRDKTSEACQCSETQLVATVLCSSDSNLLCRLAHASMAGKRIREAVG